MNLKKNYQKFRWYLINVGFLYAIWRGIKYIIFLFRIKLDNKVRIDKIAISKGKLKLIHSKNGIGILWNDNEITQGIGLNCAINTLGLLTDSSRADWRLLEQRADHFVFYVRFRDLPLSQKWYLKISTETEVQWSIETEIEEDLHIDEHRIICLVSPNYKEWINGYECGDFPQIRHWQDMPVANTNSRMVGVRFPKGGLSIPPFSFDFLDNDFGRVEPFIQNTSREINSHIIGIKIAHNEESKHFIPGAYNIFSGRITIYRNDSALDMKMDCLRNNYFKNIQNSLIKGKKKLKIMLANLPWYYHDKWGVRAGSRWPHMKDRSEGNYLPFPFFLAYATSLLKKNDFNADLIDAVALQYREDEFIEELLHRDFDILVTETSVPSFFYDLQFLKRLSSLGFRIVLCGPNSEIYRTNFLEENTFIDYVIFGEYELTLLELVRSLSLAKNDLSSIDGLIWRDGKKIMKNSPRRPFDINILPWPHRENLPMDKYWDLPGDIPYPSVQLVASRGCPFSCNFCLWPQVLYQKNHYRTRHIKDVIDEMEFLVREKGFKSLYFDDDTFNIGKERMFKFCNSIKERKLQHTPWAIMARPDLMDDDILVELKSAGLWAVKYGVESVSEKLLENCRKNLNFKKSEHMIMMTKKLDIKVHLTFTFGLSGETKGSIKKTIDYALKMEPDSVQFSILTPFPGTDLFEELDKQGRILTRDWSKYDGHYNCVFQPESLSSRDLLRAKEQAYRRWGDYLRKKRGLLGDVERFRDYLEKYGFKKTALKTKDYFEFIWLKRKRYLNGDN